MNGDNVVIVWSAAAAGIGLVAKGGRDLYSWRKALTLQTAATERLLYGDKNLGWPGIMAAHNQLIDRVDGMQVDLSEGLGRIRAVEKMVKINGLSSPGIGDAVGRIEQQLSGNSRQETMDQQKKPE